MAENYSPFPYKLVVLQNKHDWREYGVFIFDHAEHPLPGIQDQSLIQLANCCSGQLTAIRKVVDDINSVKELADTSCKYCLIATSFNTMQNDWNRRVLVLKLADSNIAYREVVGESFGRKGMRQISEVFTPNGTVTPQTY